MFFALHPDRAQYAERANLLDHPEQIKIVPQCADAGCVYQVIKVQVCFRYIEVDGFTLMGKFLIKIGAERS